MVEGTINPRLMGREGQLGNALIGISLFRIYNVIKQTIREIEGEEIPSERVPGEVEEVEEIEASSNNIKKMSDYLWGFFENRMRLK
jgi:hypothetical protein